MASIRPKAAVEQLLELTQQTNAAVNDVAAVIKRLEDVLEARGVGIESSIQVSASEDDEAHITFETHLGYQRYGGRFRFVVVRGSVELEDWSEKAWSECSRDIKLETFGSLPKLLEEMIKEMRSTLEETRETAATVVELIAALDAKPE